MPGAPSRSVAGERGGRLARLAAVVAGAALIVAGLWMLPAARLVDLRLFDILSTIAPTPAPPDVVVVAIDEPSFSEVGRQWPWPRSLHGRLVEALRAAGAKAIGIDLVFAEPSTPEEDAALADALGPDTVLAADESLIDTPQAAQLVRTEPLPALVAGGARIGIASVAVDPDGVVRKVPDAPDSFAREVLRAAGIEPAEAPPGALMAVSGPARTFGTVSYYQAIDPANFLPPGALEDKIVLVGLSLQTAPTVDGGGADAFATAWTLRSERLVPGVELQATALANLRAASFVRPAPTTLAVAAVIAATVLAGFAVRRDTGVVTIAVGAAGTLAFAAASLALLWATRTFLSPSAPALAFAGVLAAQGAVDFARERRIRRTVTNAFRHYLAPELVERLARDPTLLKPGGERRTLTILFCDVRGFTAIAERMKDDPDRLTTLVNRLLDPLSEQVLVKGGTIDKYIGDCVMAFWNAPLEDPLHPLHAVEAALGMVEAAKRFDAMVRAEAAARGEHLPPIAVGIGVNTGDVVVGNMGSSARFDYSVLGDAVNLASRFEGTCRTYEVPLVIGEDTRRLVADRYATALLDRVAVKGRTDPVAVHTVLGPAGSVAADVLDEHARLVEDALARRLALDDPRPARLSAALPMLATFYGRLAARAFAA